MTRIENLAILLQDELSEQATINHRLTVRARLMAYGAWVQQQQNTKEGEA